MFDKDILKKIESLQKQVLDLESNVVTDRSILSKLKNYKKILYTFDTCNQINKNINDINDLIDSDKKDTLFVELLQKELEIEIQKLSLSKKELINLLNQKLPEPIYESILIEIRSCAGGKEANLFAMDLLKMYIKFCDKKGWINNIIDNRDSDIGVKEAILQIKNVNAYPMLKFESGVHRVQRIPTTEASGRVHTSTASVAVIPEVKISESIINISDLKIDTFRASGAGGQHVNVTDSAVRITHIPTGIVAECQNQRSQHQNKDMAMIVLQSKVRLIQKQQERDKLNAKRQVMIGTGERSEKIRTYNFPQNRLTDHRYNINIYNLDKILEGCLDELINKCCEDKTS